MVQIRMENQYKAFQKSVTINYLSLDVRSETGQCTEGGGNVMCSALPDRQLSEAGFVLANSITYFNMSGSGNRAGPEPYFTYLRGKDTGTLLPNSAGHGEEQITKTLSCRVNGKPQVC